MSITIDTVLKFDGDFDGHGDGEVACKLTFNELIACFFCVTHIAGIRHTQLVGLHQLIMYNVHRETDISYTCNMYWMLYLVEHVP